MRKASSFIRLLLLTTLLTAVGGVAILYLLRQNIDPRFYRFLESGTGRTVAKIMGWSVDFDLPPPDMPESEMSDAEVKLKRELEEQMQRERPKHRLIMKSGETLTGRIVSFDADTITFMKRFGESGEIAVKFQKSRVLDVEQATNSIPKITYRDVQLKKEFPKFEFHRSPPYSIVTDSNFFQARKSVRLLQRLHDEFTSTFGQLITRPERGQGIQLLFFMEEKHYRKYADKYAPQLENSSGFYSPKPDRLIVFDQVTSEQLRDAKRELKRRERLYRRNATTPEELESVKIWRSDAARSIVRHAEEQNEYTIRHEGAHQLFFTYGIHSLHHAENSWLIEGFAVYCEGVRLGDRLPERVAIIKSYLRENELIPLGELVNSRSALGLFVFGNEERVHLAYAESWALVQFLMQPKYRSSFFDYIFYVRDPENLSELSSRSRLHTLAKATGLTATQLNREWMLYLSRL